MTSKEGVQLIGSAFGQVSTAENWADLGCGDGFFTKVLASILAEGSTIYAVDKRCQYISSPPNVSIEFIKGDFRSDLSSIPPLHGILMANSLHFIKEKQAFLESLLPKLVLPGKLVFVEYDMSAGNPWVPHPIMFEDLQNLLQALGATAVRKLGNMQSMYGSQQLYACEADFK